MGIYFIVFLFFFLTKLTNWHIL